MLREAGAPGLDGFGIALPNAALMARVKGTHSIPTGSSHRDGSRSPSWREGAGR